MNIIDIIQKDLPDFTGICVREGDVPIEKVRDFKISLAWKMNPYRARQFKKILIVGAKENKGKYFIADIVSVLSIKKAYEEGTRKEGIDYQEEVFGEWISARIEGKIKDNGLNERFAILFENATEILSFSQDFSFSRTSLYYVNSENQPIIPSGEFVEIENFGKLNTAKVKINGLTLIAGVNDTGKSTLGKILFSIIKATSRYKQDLKESKEHILMSKMERLYNVLRRSSFSEKMNFNTIREEFSPNRFLGQLINFLNPTFQLNLFDTIIKKEHTTIDELFVYKKNLLLKWGGMKEVSLLEDIKTTYLQEENKTEQITRALGRALFSEFITDITPKDTTKKTHIKYFTGKTPLLNVELEKNKITKLDFTEDLSYRDVVFIETPLLIQMYDLIQSSDTMFEEEENSNFLRRRSRVSLHIKDLINKIEEAKYYSNKIFEDNFDSMNLLRTISSIIHGGYIFDEESSDILFSQLNNKKKTTQIKAVNTASGIKSFGIIQLLLQANILNDQCLLIIDEPENHLHPEWQVKYAQILIELIKNEIPVIVTSHSPYMIQALKFYSEKNKLEDRCNYYFAEMKEGETQSNLIDVTDNLNVIFSKLAAPLNELVWQ